MKITILGCGVYGLALAHSFLVKDTNQVTMWSKFQKEVDSLKNQYHNISFSTDLREAINETDLLVIAIPVAFLAEVMRSLQHIYQGKDILVASKGIDVEKKRFAYEIVQDYLGDVPIGIISGGTFAADMIEQKVMGLTLATKSERIRKKVKSSLESTFLKIQSYDDLIGISVCGAIKNVMAIGFGLLDGAAYPPSSRFLFLTEAIYEIQFLIQKLGGKPDSIMSYAGLDDIMMTCTSCQSRNYTLGKMLGEQQDKIEIEKYKARTTIEGLGTSLAIYQLANDKKIELPISTKIYQILYENLEPIALIHYLEEK